MMKYTKSERVRYAGRNACSRTCAVGSVKQRFGSKQRKDAQHVLVIKDGGTPDDTAHAGAVRRH